MHDRSQSGATLFVEPEGVVEDNNDLVQAAREEEVEVLRVLQALTDAVSEALPELEALVDDMGRLDLAFARAELADQMEATEPIRRRGAHGRGHGSAEPAPARRRRGRRRSARWSPWISASAASKPLLVITGPNAGGKTVALKTLGLLLPDGAVGAPRAGARGRPAARCSPRSSPSSATTRAWPRTSRRSPPSSSSSAKRSSRWTIARSLLLDELGAGTDPDEGAALAQAVLEELAERGALCVASTHLEPLKGFASTHPRARNASVEFDSERLQPTFRLVYDRPGQSYALAIGARLGLPAHLIERAEGYRSAQRRQLEALLQRLEERDRIEAEHAQAVERREVESATLLSRAEAKFEAATRQAAELTARAKADAQRMLTEIRRSVNAEWDRLKREDKTRESLEQSRKRLVETARGVEGVVENLDPGGRAAAAGDRVEVPHLGLKGDVLTVDGGTATVQAGAVTVKVPAQALRVVGRADTVRPPLTLPSPLRGEGTRSSPPPPGRGAG